MLEATSPALAPVRGTADGESSQHDYDQADYPLLYCAQCRIAHALFNYGIAFKCDRRYTPDVTVSGGVEIIVLPTEESVLLLAQATWRRLDGRELLPLVRAGVTFKDGLRVERDHLPEGKVTKVKSRKKTTQDQPGKVAA